MMGLPWLLRHQPLPAQHLQQTCQTATTTHPEAAAPPALEAAALQIHWTSLYGRRYDTASTVLLLLRNCPRCLVGPRHEAPSGSEEAGSSTTQPTSVWELVRHRHCSLRQCRPNLDALGGEGRTP